VFLNTFKNHPRSSGGAVRCVLIAYEVWGSTPLFVCSRSLEEPLPPGTGISLGEAWDTLVHTKKKKHISKPKISLGAVKKSFFIFMF
jgi:hypothetical protein